MRNGKQDNKLPKSGVKIGVGVLFIFCVIAALLLVFSPLLLRWDFFRSLVSSFLLPFGQLAYKNAYISMMSSLLGSAIAITGAIWTQRVLRRFDEEKKSKEAEKNLKAEADLVYYEFSTAIDNLQDTLKKVYPLVKRNLLPAGGDALIKFVKNVQEKPIICDNEVRSSILQIRGKLSKNSIVSLLYMQQIIQKIAVLTDPIRKNHGSDDYQAAYYTAWDLFQGTSGEAADAATFYELKSANKQAMVELADYANGKDE